jgi:hypothetical protein
VERAPVDVGEDGDAAYIKLPESTDDAHRDFTPIGDQYLPKHDPSDYHAWNGADESKADSLRTGIRIDRHTGDNGAGIGASHPTGWMGLVARLIDLLGEPVF